MIDHQSQELIETLARVVYWVACVCVSGLLGYWIPSTVYTLNGVPTEDVFNHPLLVLTTTVLTSLAVCLNYKASCKLYRVLFTK